MAKQTEIETGVSNGGLYLSISQFGIKAEDAANLIAVLKKLPGAYSFDGDISTQVVFPLAGGSVLRFSIGDWDNAELGVDSGYGGVDGGKYFLNRGWKIWPGEKK